MDIPKISEQLSEMVNPYDWSAQIKHLSPQERATCKAMAEPLWVERMLNKGLLLVHPEIAHELKDNHWKPNDLHRKMIWASVLASMTGDDSKPKFREIKDKLKKKYGFHWWEDVYRRIKPAFAARERILKNENETGAGTAMLASKSTVMACALYEEKKRVLEGIPKV